MDLLDRLLGHDDWATTQLLELSRGLAETQLDQRFDVGHRTLRHTFEHMIFSVEYWTSLMIWQSGDARRGDRDHSLAALILCHERSYATFAAFARQVRDEQRLDDTFVGHFDGPMTFGGAIVHVALHNEGHRIEALHILERLSVPDLPEVDHGLWDFKRRDF